MFWHVENLVKQSMKSGVMPWDFKIEGTISAQIRHDKRARQDWYRNVSTVHNYYTSLEPANSNMRPSKDNPPRAIHAFCVDYDVAIPPERIDEAIKALKIKPAWVERSLGGNARLIWTLPQPLRTETWDFTCFVLQQAVKWLHLDILPALDEEAFTTPTRLLCNGGEWKKTGAGDIPANELQAFFVKCAKEFNFNGEAGAEVPLDIVEAELKKRYPSFTWPSDFTPDSQGPTFWIPESTSPMSAILKAEGMITFAAHASKPFYSWRDLLGPEFIRQYQIESISKATNDIWWDTKRFWGKKETEGGAVYVPIDPMELTNYFRVNCRLSAKPGPDGCSAVDNALNHIYRQNHIVGAAPFVFRPTGLTTYQGDRVLNTYINRPCQPAAEPQEWGVNFPFLAALLDGIFNPKEQLIHFLAWWKHAYESALWMRPYPGQNVFMMGGRGVGKTFLNREVVGLSLGGHVDASAHILKDAQFNSEFYKSPLWCIDDDTSNGSDRVRQHFSANLKKIAANQSFQYRKKFEVGLTIEWMGRVISTLNLDYASSRLLGPLDDSSSEKTCLFRCIEPEERTYPFYDRQENERRLKAELPYLLRYLLDWKVPETKGRDPRYGYVFYHEPTLLDKAMQSGNATPFKEILRDSLKVWFEGNQSQKEWTGNVTTLIRLLYANPLNDFMLRSIKLEQANRYLEAIQRDPAMQMKSDTGADKERIWIFGRPEPQPKTT